VIEVEIKCKPTPEEKARLLKDAIFIGEEKLTDIYYESISYELSVKDFWLRTRNDKFVLKIPASSYSNTSTSKHEIEDEQEIRKILKLSQKDNLIKALSIAGYNPTYTLIKTRQKYTKSGFVIDIDHANFKNLIFDLIEIETMVQTQEEIIKATQNLIAFAQQHGITIKPIPGNLISLIKVVNPKHYKILEKIRIQKRKFL